MKNPLYRLIIAVSLPLIARTGFAQTTILTDNFTVDQSVYQQPNYEIGSRQTGSQSPSPYTMFNSGDNIQIGNPTDVGQPGGSSNPNYLLMLNGGVYNNLAYNDSVLGGNNPLSISFNLYSGNPGSGWISCQFGPLGSNPYGQGTAAGPNQTYFGFLVQGDMSGMQVFNGSATAVNDAGVSGVVTSTAWDVIFSGAGGVGSPFDGTTEVSLYNGANLLYQANLSTPLDSSGDVLGFQSDNLVGGIANLDIVATPEPATMALVGLGGLSLLLLRRK
jgi:hypothetical protein